MAKTDKKPPFSGRELSIFCSQLALMLRSGIQLHEGLETLRDDGTDSARQAEVLTNLSKKLRTGMNLRDAFGEAGVFPQYMIGMIEVGERSGSLDVVMESLAEYYDRDDRLRQDIYSAVTYPLLLLGMIAAVIVVLVVRVLPIFQQVFNDLGATLTGPAGFFLDVGMNASRWAMGLVVVLVVIVGLLLLYAKMGGGSKLLQLAEKIPAIGNLSRKIAAGRFASALSLMLSSGYDARPALDIIGELITNRDMKARLDKLKADIDSGETIGNAIRNAEIFQGLYGRMISVGYKTGSIDGVTKEVAEHYEEDVSVSLGNLIAVLEPTLVICFTVVIGVILVSVMLPLMGLMGSMG
jgi:type IV pilus assembly protein PilC